ncbi:MAG: hypothetical protein LH472_06165 [Pyrinomonadaceae bacterium]|nr:hypothetical protein [Pyrinomonadaceae bacterium]
MKLKIFIALLLVSPLAFIAFSQMKSKAFTPAEDFPREALIYVQIADLPAFIKLWNESKLNEKYGQSENFADFKNNHLGLKLASRWQEFNAATGFPIDLETVAKLADNQAAIAVYDIGKLEFVFVAPVSEEIFTVTKFVQNQDKFSAETLGDGTTIYRATVEADRGRQRQDLIFTNVKGRFILATSEKLLMRTLNNINGKAGKNRLIDEPSFKILSEKTTPHTATVWVNQTALNDDYYFKRYWLMSDLKELQNIRAGIFDFEMQTGKLIENRRFLLNEPVNAAPISNARASEILAFLPENIPFYRLQKANSKTIDEALEQTIFDRRIENTAVGKNPHFSSYEDYSSGDYESLGEKFDETVDDVEDDEAMKKQTTDVDFSSPFQSADPQAVLTFTAPQVLPAPRFVEFRRVAIFNLAAPTNFNRAAFESAMAGNLAAQILIASPNIKLNWETKSANDAIWRELNLPMLGRTVGYAVRGDAIILTSNTDFLREILTNAKAKSIETADKPFSELTVVNFNQRENAFDRVFNELNKKKAANDFFTGSISSLLDSISEVESIQIKKSYSQNNFEEELIFFFDE